MLAQGLMLLSIGLPCVALGLYYRKAAKAAREEVSKTAEKKKGKTGKKKRDKDQRGKERGTSGGLSLIIGGLAFALFGLGLVIKAVAGP